MRLNVFVIKKHMAVNGWTQGELAIRAGISRQGLNNILQRGSCSVCNAGKIAKALLCEIDDIVEDR